MLDCRLEYNFYKIRKVTTLSSCNYFINLCKVIIMDYRLSKTKAKLERNIMRSLQKQIIAAS